MSEAGRSAILLPDLTSRQYHRSKAKAVHRISTHLLDALFDALEEHPDPDPQVLLAAGVSFLHALCADAADRMALSVEQRESFYLTAVAALTRTLQGEVERLSSEPERRPKPTRKGVPNRVP